MKKILLMSAALILLAGGAYADMHKAKEQPAAKDKPMMGQMMCEEMMKGKPMPMMGQMMGQGMVMQNMMKTIQDIARIQDRIVAGMTEEEKKTARQELKALMERMDKMMMEMPGMMMKGMMGGQQQDAPKDAPKTAEPKKEDAAKPQEHKH
ncbi:MAG: hypothetical protein U1C55_03595 [Smithellaceae bacterium]|nr:hypothetical protein [Smithellaceae bacterium]